VDTKNRMSAYGPNGDGYGLGPVTGFCKYGKEPLVSIKRRVFPDQHTVYQLLKNNFVPRCSEAEVFSNIFRALIKYGS
jgi:hypothetical protein